MPQAKKTKAKSAPSTSTHTRSAKTPLEEGVDVWTHFAKQTGDTFEEFLRRFGEEQQKNYERWVAALKETSTPPPAGAGKEEMRARLDQWNKVSKEIADRVTEAFLSTLGPQRETFEKWMRPLLPQEATVQERTQELTELTTKFWAGMFGDVSRKYFEGLRTGKSPAEFYQLQENALKEFGDTYSKLAYAYFSSPAFVSLFGRTLDNSLELQKAFNQGESVMSKVTGLPTRRDIIELNQAIKDLSSKINTGRKGV
jgi:hypothetical protein